MTIHKLFPGFHNNFGLPSRLVWQEGGGDNAPKITRDDSPAPAQIEADIKAGRESGLVVPKYVPPPGPKEKEKEKEKKERKEVVGDPINPGPFNPEGTGSKLRKWIPFTEGEGGVDARPIQEKFPDFKPADLVKRLSDIENEKFTQMAGTFNGGAAQQASELVKRLKDAVIYEGTMNNWTPDSVVEVYTKMLERVCSFCSSPVSDQIFTRRVRDPLDPAYYESSVTHIIVPTQANPRENPHLNTAQKQVLEQRGALMTRMMALTDAIKEKVFTGLWDTVATGQNAQKVNYLENYYFPFARRWFIERTVVEGQDPEAMIKEYSNVVDKGYEAAQVLIANPDFWLTLPYRF